MSDISQRRDALADLAVCSAATPGPWHHCATALWACVTSKDTGAGTILLTAGTGVVELQQVDARANARFAALARAALPHWIERASAAEQAIDSINQWVSKEIHAKTESLQKCFVREAERRMDAEVQLYDLRREHEALTQVNLEMASLLAERTKEVQGG